MAPEIPVTTNVKEASGAPPTSASQHVGMLSSGDSIPPQNSQPSKVGQEQGFDRDASHDAVSVDTGTRPKRTQCKNACTNCQKACKRCDDNRPCQRCISYGTINTCVDSKHKERKKGIKRGPYKKRDNKGYPTPDGKYVESGLTNGMLGHYPSMPYIGPVHYPLAFYHPMFTFAPVTGQALPHTGNATEGGDAMAAPHFPIGFYPATFISYPGSYPHYPIPLPGLGGSPSHGFRYTYPPFPGSILPRLPNTIANTNGDSPPNINMHGPDISRKLDGVEKEKQRDIVIGQLEDVEGDSSDTDDERFVNDVVE